VPSLLVSSEKSDDGTTQGQEHDQANSNDDELCASTFLGKDFGQPTVRFFELVGRAIQQQSGHMTGHPIEVTLPDAPLKVRGNPELLSMALGQFLDNAAKYSFIGEKVKVSAWDSRSEVTISVHNFGPAIPMSERERIFQRFYRGEESKRMAEGTGVGLSTVKMAAEAHRGHTWVTSDAEEGTTFFLSLPHDGRRTD